MTKKELAYHARISDAHVRFMCQGKRTPGVVIALRIARALGTSVEELWGQDANA